MILRHKSVCIPEFALGSRKFRIAAEDISPSAFDCPQNNRKQNFVYPFGQVCEYGLINQDIPRQILSVADIACQDIYVLSGLSVQGLVGCVRWRFNAIPVIHSNRLDRVCPTRRPDKRIGRCNGQNAIPIEVIRTEASRAGVRRDMCSGRS
jgi:hypothetical protein